MNREERRAKSLESFSQKYDVKCEVAYTELIGDSPELRDEIHVYIASYMDEGESAIVYSWGKDEEVYTEDNLFGYIIRADYENEIKQIVASYFDECKVYITYMSGAFDDSLGKTSTLQDAYDAGEKMITNISIICRTDANESDYKKAIDEIAEKLYEKKLLGSIHGYAVSDVDDFTKIDRLNLNRQVNAFAQHAAVKMPFDVYNTKSYK